MSGRCLPDVSLCVEPSRLADISNPHDSCLEAGEATLKPVPVKTGGCFGVDLHLPWIPRFVLHPGRGVTHTCWVYPGRRKDSIVVVSIEGKSFTSAEGFPSASRLPHRATHVSTAFRGTLEPRLRGACAPCQCARDHSYLPK